MDGTGKNYTRTFKKTKNVVDKAGGGWYTESAKQRRRASASPPAPGKEVNNVVTRPPFSVVCCCADAIRYPRFVIFGWRCSTIAKLVHELNEDINDKEIRLIGAQGEQLGIMAPAEALKIADEQGLDLVKISPQAVPPVCKLMNYGKFRFEQSK